MIQQQAILFLIVLDHNGTFEVPMCATVGSIELSNQSKSNTRETLHNMEGAACWRDNCAFFNSWYKPVSFQNGSKAREKKTTC